MFNGKPTGGNETGKQLIAGNLDKAKPKQIMLRESQRKLLKELAFKTGHSESKLVRDAIDKYLDNIR